MKIQLSYSFKGFFWCMGLAILVVALAILDDGLHDKIINADLAIVPGNTVEMDGKPSKRLQARLDKAIEFFRAGHCTSILVSGAMGKEGYDEAEVMKNYLINHGIDQQVIYADSSGINTFATARYAAGLIRTQGFKQPMLVSQFFHISRLRLALQKHGVEPVGHVHADYFELRDAYSLVREVFGFLAYTLKSAVAI